MNLKRITISMPEYLYKQLTESVPDRQISKYVTESIEQRLVRERSLYDNPVQAFFELRDALPNRSREEILENIRKGRK